MKNEKIPFCHLQKLLLDLGFAEKVVTRRYRIFEHVPSETLLFYHNYRAEDPITWADHVKTRKFLDERGLLEGDHFDALLHRHQNDFAPEGTR